MPLLPPSLSHAHALGLAPGSDADNGSGQLLPVYRSTGLPSPRAYFLLGVVGELWLSCIRSAIAVSRLSILPDISVTVACE